MMQATTGLTDKTINQLLYHYTSGSALAGILESGCLWASDLHCLNDTKEFTHALDVFLESAKFSGKASGTRASFIQKISDELRKASAKPAYVACFSEMGDLLSQWKNYCPPGNGYALGFARHELQEVGQGFTVAQCSYEREKQKHLIQSLLQEVLPRADSELDEGIQDFLDQFCKIAPIIKHPGFSEEREWRLFAGEAGLENKGICVRTGRNGFIPYVPIKIGQRGSIPALKTVIIGPNPDVDLAVRGLRALFKSWDMEPPDIGVSEVPFRN